MARAALNNDSIFLSGILAAAAAVTRVREDVEMRRIGWLLPVEDVEIGVWLNWLRVLLCKPQIFLLLL